MVISTGGQAMKKIGVTDFKARCLGLLDRLGPEGLVIT